MNIEALIGPVITGLFFFALLLEHIAPREASVVMRGWRLAGFVFFGINAAINIGLPLLLPIEFITTHSLLPGASLGIVGGAVIGFVTWTFAYYWLHRLEHRFSVLWRLLHQLHHSPARVDVSGFAFGHPFDIVAAVTLNLMVLVGVLGLHPQAVALIGLYSACVALIQHVNVTTPRWMEWFMQRPEAHVRHHEFGQHAGNYADWPVWDKLFGTYRPPVTTPLRYGFAPPAMRRIGAMLAFVDVNHYRFSLRRHK